MFIIQFVKKKSRSTIKIHFMDQAKFIIICTMEPVQNKPLYKINKHNPCPSFIKKKMPVQFMYMNKKLDVP